MGYNEQENQKSGGVPAPDDDWWAAILKSIDEQHPPERTTETRNPRRNSEKSRRNLRELGDSVVNLPETAKVLTETQTSDRQDWEWANELYRQDEAITLQVTGHNRGGILVETENLKGFVPISHLVQIPHTCDPNDGIEAALERYIGKTVQLKVIECDPARGRVVFSERAAQAEPGRRLQLLDEIQKGDCLHGSVTTVTDFGAFVDLGGMEGLVHISELSWGRVQHPRDVVSVGENVRVTVLDVDRSRSRVALSIKRLHPNPWENIADRYQPGQVAEAVITSVVSFGAFARLDSGIDGLIHASELGGNGGSKRPGDILRKGQRVRVSILNIEPERQRLGLRLVEVES